MFEQVHPALGWRPLGAVLFPRDYRMNNLKDTVWRINYTDTSGNGLVLHVCGPEWLSPVIQKIRKARGIVTAVVYAGRMKA